LLILVRQICKEEGIALTSFSYDWILKLTLQKRSAYIFGYKFGINNAASAKLCDDKCAAYEVLNQAKIPSVKHELFLNAGNVHDPNGIGNWSILTSLLREHSILVVKPNEGSGGHNVLLTRTQVELERAVQTLLSTNRTIAVSPYYEVLKEYRIVILQQKVKLVYAKNVPCIVGDGHSTLHKLVLNYMEQNHCFLAPNLTKEQEECVLKQGEEFLLGWKSNLGQGAEPQLLESGELYEQLCQLAIQAAAQLDICFAAVDVIRTSQGLYILEVNSGIMMEKFIAHSTQNGEIAKAIYREAILMMLGSPKG
jgi:glutathione synthase/RimK-type ligase-like ATP-grasp enzyme